MSGSLRLAANGEAPGAHDHIDWTFDNGCALRYRDPRRFGAMLWWEGPPAHHPLLKRLGPEPFSDAFHGDWLFDRSRGRRAAVKAFLMDGRIVAGIGNIYANEALFEARIHPGRSAGRIARHRYALLAGAVRRIMARSIDAGGTSFRDYVRSDGEPGVPDAPDGLRPSGRKVRTLRDDTSRPNHRPAFHRMVPALSALT